MTPTTPTNAPDKAPTYQRDPRYYRASARLWITAAVSAAVSMGVLIAGVVTFASTPVAAAPELTLSLIHI